MTKELLKAMNAIMAEAARTVREERRLNPKYDLTSIWMSTLERLSSEVTELNVAWTPDVSADDLKRKYRGKPWSYERFVAYATKQPLV